MAPKLLHCFCITFFTLLLSPLFVHLILLCRPSPTFCCFYVQPVEKLLAKEEPGLYHFINQGCLDVDGMDDQEEMRIADVCTVIRV